MKELGREHEGEMRMRGIKRGLRVWAWQFGTVG